MAKNKNAKPKGKQFTPRETVLLVALVLAVALYGYFTYIYEPVTSAIAQLKTENNTLKTEYEARQSLIDHKTGLTNDLNHITQEIYGYKSQYFKTPNQEHFIKTLELDLLSDEKLDITSLSFSEAQPSVEFITEEGGSVPLESNTVTFPFKGTYEKLIELVQRIEEYKNLIRINSLDISYVDLTRNPSENRNPKEVLYQGNMSIEFFIIPQEYQYLWKDQLPNYAAAGNTLDGLFNYRDGAQSIPPFLVEVEEVPPLEEVIIPEYNGGYPSIDWPSNPGRDETTPDDGEDEEDQDNQEYETYLVKSGDTIFSISLERYNSTQYMDDIMALNKITDARKLRSGRTILLPHRK